MALNAREGTKESNEKSSKRLICQFQTQGQDLCELHSLAREKLRHGYEVWRKAYGNIPYHDYLRSLITRPETGDAVVAVAKFILSSKGGETGKDVNNLREA